MRKLWVVGLTLFFGLNAWAAQELVDGQKYTINDQYSNKDMTGWDLTDRIDLCDMVISNTCFSHEIPDSSVFPNSMTGVTFIACNLDNCTIPPGNTLLHCSTRRFKAQGDGKDWIVDKNNNPVSVIQ